MKPHYASINALKDISERKEHIQPSIYNNPCIFIYEKITNIISFFYIVQFFIRIL